MGQKPRGFSLLEVMVSIAILGLVLTVILSAQGGVAASNKAAGNAGVAITLARCRMTETEEKLLKNGYSEVDQLDTEVPCCDDENAGGFNCDVRVERVTLPTPATSGADGGGSGADGLGLSALTGAVGGAAPGASAGGGLSSVLSGASALNLSGDGGLAGLGTAVGQGVLGGQGAEGLLNMAMGLVYPVLKPVLEASIRRVTITVHWKEGPFPKELSVVQYVTNPQKGGLISDVLPGQDPAAAATGAAGAAGAVAPPTGTSTGGVGR